MQADSCKYEFVLDNLSSPILMDRKCRKVKSMLFGCKKKTSRAFELKFPDRRNGVGAMWPLFGWYGTAVSTDKHWLSSVMNMPKEGWQPHCNSRRKKVKINVAWFMYSLLLCLSPWSMCMLPGRTITRQWPANWVSIWKQILDDDMAEDTFARKTQWNWWMKKKRRNKDPVGTN